MAKVVCIYAGLDYTPGAVICNDHGKKQKCGVFGNWGAETGDCKKQKTFVVSKPKRRTVRKSIRRKRTTKRRR